MKSSRLFMLGLVLLLSGTSVFGMDGGYYDYDGSDDIVGSYQNVYANFVDDLENEQGAVNMSDGVQERSLVKTALNHVITIALLALFVCIAWCLAKGATKIALKLVLVVAVLLVVGVLLGWFSSEQKDAVKGVVVNCAHKVVNEAGKVVCDPKAAVKTVANAANDVKGKTIKLYKDVYGYADVITGHVIK
eukprot:137754_1